MSRYIDADGISAELREMAKDEFFSMAGAAYSTIFEIIAKAIDKMPAEGVRENVHGRWIIKASSLFWSYETVCCSECGWSISRIIDTPARPTRKPYVRKRDDYNYCPHCGAKMGDEK